MAKKLSKKHQLVLDAFRKYPLKSDRQIAEVTKVSQPQVSTYRKEYALAIDSEFIAIIAGKFIHEFGYAADHWKQLIQELEELKSAQKTIFKKTADGHTFPEQVDLEPLDKLAIIKEQAALRERILFLASQGEVREVIKIMRSGQIPEIPA